MAVTRTRRVCALAALGALGATWGGLPRCVVQFKEPEIEGGGAARTARQARALRAVARHMAQHRAGEVVGSAFDTNAIGEAWGSSAMNHWVDRAGASSSAERLEEELMAMKIGRMASTVGRRQAMRAQRLERQRELLLEESPRPGDAMLHWADRPSAIESPESLEEELVSMRIGGHSGMDGPREAMRLRRLARQRELAGQAVNLRVSLALPAFGQAGGRMARPQAEAAPRLHGPTLMSSQYDTNALHESFQVSSAGDAAPGIEERLERELESMKIGGVRGTEGKRQAMRLRRAARQQKVQG